MKSEFGTGQKPILAGKMGHSFYVTFFLNTKMAKNQCDIFAELYDIITKKRNHAKYIRPNRSIPIWPFYEINLNFVKH